MFRVFLLGFENLSVFFCLFLSLSFSYSSYLCLHVSYRILVLSRSFDLLYFSSTRCKRFPTLKNSFSLHSRQKYISSFSFIAVDTTVNMRFNLRRNCSSVLVIPAKSHRSISSFFMSDKVNHLGDT